MQSEYVQNKKMEGVLRKALDGSTGGLFTRVVRPFSRGGRFGGFHGVCEEEGTLPSRMTGKNGSLSVRKVETMGKKTNGRK